MDFPALMPQTLSYCLMVSSEEEMFGLLVQKPADLILFFETASDDETWSEAHLGLMSTILEWLTVQGWNDKLSYELQKRIAVALQTHHSILGPVVPQNVTVKLQDSSIEANSLLLSVTSSFFKNLLIECRDKNASVILLKQVPYALFSPVLAFANTGHVADLWKLEQSEVEAILRKALSWGVDSVAKACQLTLKKYITRDNAIDLLIQAQQELWVDFKQECIDFINDKMSGFALEAEAQDFLTFEFYEFSEAALFVFHRLQGLITHLKVRKTLSEHVQFSHVVQDCPKLMMLDLSGSSLLSPYLSAVPKGLQGIDLSECLWLEPRTIRKIAEHFPSLRQLILVHNYHLNFLVWGELVKFKSLRLLDLSRCRQIVDKDVQAIIKSCPTLTDLILDGCSKIGDGAFFELAHHLPRLNSLSLASCSISDSALLEIAAHSRNLSSLNLSRCSQLTEKGFKGLARHAFSLRELKLHRVQVSPSTIEEIRARHPYLRILS